MLLLKDLPSKASLLKLVARYPGADVKAIQEFATILRVASDLSASLDKLLNSHGLMQGRWWILVLLLREENLTSSPSVLAEKIGVTKATMTGFINGLQREGLVSRLTNVEDGRKFMIQLTSLGQEKLDQVVPDYYQKVGALMSTLSETQRESIVEVMKILGSNIDVMKL